MGAENGTGTIQALDMLHGFLLKSVCSSRFSSFGLMRRLVLSFPGVEGEFS